MFASHNWSSSSKASIGFSTAWEIGHPQGRISPKSTSLTAETLTKEGHAGKGKLPCEVWDALNGTSICSCTQDLALSILKSPMVWSTFAERSQPGLTTGLIPTCNRKSRCRKRLDVPSCHKEGSNQADTQELQCSAAPLPWSHPPACCTVPVETIKDFRTSTGHTNGVKMVLKRGNKRHFGTKLAQTQSPQRLHKIERKNP